MRNSRSHSKECKSYEDKWLACTNYQPRTRIKSMKTITFTKNLSQTHGTKIKSILMFNDKKKLIKPVVHKLRSQLRTQKRSSKKILDKRIKTNISRMTFLRRTKGEIGKKKDNSKRRCTRILKSRNFKQIRKRISKTDFVGSILNEKKKSNARL